MEETTKDLKRDNPEIKDKLIADYLARAYNVITLNFVKNEEDFNNQLKYNSIKENRQAQNLDYEQIEEINNKKLNNYNPKFTHQLFGDEESIYGYKDLSIDIYFTAGRLQKYIKIEYEDKMPDADNFMLKFDEWFFGTYTTDIQNFRQQLKVEEIFVPTGQICEQYEINGEQYKIYKSDNQCDGFDELRVNSWPILLFAIEVASYCNTSDYWTYFTIYKESPNKQNIFVGLLTMTEFHIDLNYKRNRISQVFILQQYQRQGHGLRITESVYKQSIQDEFCLQITIEDCSPEFQAVRDVVETKLVMESRYLKWLEEYQPQSICIPTILDQIKLDNNLVQAMRKKLKLPSFSIYRAFEILLLSRIKVDNPKLVELVKKKISDRIKNQMQHPPRKIPFLCLDKQIVKFDVETITQLQNKQLNQEQFYQKDTEFTLDQYKVALKKLNLLK
ncbi:Acyl-CoA N-acyltransferase [Pseudocohnilembus persalinus]|uniref:histone acetyltransferase n=1 Tax=Pseudocohnilembus persalinus TaxID=266149 RepID=A0A0V0QY10_PSEPJ|nr:Acyl-CoA N-acyltransferase [Pseudocohnilembus persalinus]|eukprot:KRX06989.1 Acyl-CoA N-acyltransferase [Pseudocohnilembus persalinus]